MAVNGASETFKDEEVKEMAKQEQKKKLTAAAVHAGVAVGKGLAGDGKGAAQSGMKAAGDLKSAGDKEQLEKNAEQKFDSGERNTDDSSDAVAEGVKEAGADEAKSMASGGAGGATGGAVADGAGDAAGGAAPAPGGGGAPGGVPGGAGSENDNTDIDGEPEDDKKGGALKAGMTLNALATVPAIAGAIAKMAKLAKLMQVIRDAISQAVSNIFGLAANIAGAVANALVFVGITIGVLMGAAASDATVMRDNLRYTDCHERTNFMFSTTEGDNSEAGVVAVVSALYSVLAAEGASPAEVAGILGNFQAESGIDPYAVEGIYDEPWTIGDQKETAWSRDFYVPLYNWDYYYNTYNPRQHSKPCDAVNEDGSKTCDSDRYTACSDLFCYLCTHSMISNCPNKRTIPGCRVGAFNCPSAKCAITAENAGGCCYQVTREGVPCLCYGPCDICQFRGGIGLGQWTQGRNEALRRFAEANSVYWYDYHVQIAFLIYEDETNFMTEYIGSGMSVEEATDWFYTNWERPKSSENPDTAQSALAARTALATEWFVKLESMLVNYEYAKGVLALAERNTSIARRSIMDNWAKDCGELMFNIDGSTMAKMASSYAHSSMEEAVGNDGTPIFKAVANMVHGQIVTYQACDIAVSTAIRWSGADVKFPTHSVTAQYKYMNRGEGRYKWNRMGLMDSLLLTGHLWPGDIILGTTFELAHTGHVEMYVGRDAVQRYHPKADSGMVMVGGSLGTESRQGRSPAIKGVLSGNYRVYRLAYYGPVHLGTYSRRGKESVGPWSWYNYSVFEDSAIADGDDRPRSEIKGISLPDEFVQWNSNFNWQFSWKGCADEFPIPEGTHYDILALWDEIRDGVSGNKDDKNRRNIPDLVKDYTDYPENFGEWDLIDAINWVRDLEERLRAIEQATRVP